MGALKGEVDRLKKHQSGRTTFDDLIGASPAMTLVKRLGERAAKSSIPILITGESGVGKEVIARAVHGSSERSGKPFVAVNCGAIPRSEEHTSELQSLMRISYAVFCLTKKNKKSTETTN